MHFALAFLTTTLTAVLATVVPVARQELDPSKCTCPRIELERGTHINQGVDWYQCAYASGACMWNMTGPLINTDQDNCYTFSSCVVGIRD